MYGYAGQFLRVNLNTGTTTIEHPPESELKAFLGGRGFIIPRLLSEIPKGADPYGPENLLIFATGPFTGYLPGGGRNSVGAKSPLTGGFGESEAGGFFGAELKRAGLDAIIIEGKSANPVYICIEKGKTKVLDASTIWGMDTADTETAIQQALGSNKYRTAVIGPAGEKRIPFATIHNDITHVYGRNGMGAVMGSKRLKAIAVRGDKLPEVADKKVLVALSRSIKKSPLTTCGTGLAMAGYNENGNLPVNNFKGGRFENIKKITAGALCENDMLVGMHSCFACPIRCKKRVRADTPWSVDPVYGGPEYETLAAFGSNCGVDNIFAIAKAHELCNRYGIDTISAGVVISFAMECFENGLITTGDTGGIELRFGNAEAMVEMVRLICRREGFGTTLSQGCKRAAEIIGKGSEQYAMHIKGLELPMHDPRHNQSFTIHFSLHSTGPDHCTGSFDDADGNNLGRFVVEDETAPIEKVPPHELSPAKAQFLYSVGLYRQLCNHFSLCLFVPWTLTQCLQALTAITGWDTSYQALRQAVDRTVTLARVFNLREGFSVEDEKLPDRFYSPPPSGPLKEVAVDCKQLKGAQQHYYKINGWNDRGVPTDQLLSDLDIGWCSAHIPKAAEKSL